MSAEIRLMYKKAVSHVYIIFIIHKKKKKYKDTMYISIIISSKYKSNDRCSRSLHKNYTLWREIIY